MSTDAELLRRYAADRSEAAFAELVQRHLALVYFAALRQVGGDAHRAQDVAQSVFTDLARKAATLTGHATLTGWLHTGTRFAAAKARRAESIRQQHEQEATIMNAVLQPDPARPEPVERAAEWERLRPMIDDVIHELDERDREAVLLRFFQNRPFAEIGATLHVSDDAARMRVDRALDKLRAALARRGVSSTGAALAAALANQVGATAPAGLASTITHTALAGAAAAGTAAVSTGFLMSNATTAILGAVALAATGATFFQWNRAQRAEVELATLALDRDSLRTQLRAEQQLAQRSTRDLTALRGEIDALKAKAAAPAPVPRAMPAPPQPGGGSLQVASQQKAILNNLRQLTAARDQFQLENGRPPASLDELVGETKYVKRINPVDGEIYAGLSLLRGQPMTVTTVNGVTVTYDPDGGATTKVASPSPDQVVAELTAQIGPQIGPSFQRAMQAYRAANGDSLPRNEQALLSYFATPQEAADFLEAIEAMKRGSRSK